MLASTRFLVSFIYDARLVFDNSRKYTNYTTRIFESADKLEKFFWQRMNEVPGWGHVMELSRYTPTSLGWVYNEDRTELLKRYRLVVENPGPYLELRPEWAPSFQIPRIVHLDRPR
jgi:hypothetical protein